MFYSNSSLSNEARAKSSSRWMKKKKKNQRERNNSSLFYALLLFLLLSFIFCRRLNNDMKCVRINDEI